MCKAREILGITHMANMDVQSCACLFRFWIMHQESFEFVIQKSD